MRRCADLPAVPSSVTAGDDWKGSAGPRRALRGVSWCCSLRVYTAGFSASGHTRPVVEMDLDGVLFITGLPALGQESPGLGVAACPGPELGHSMVGLGCPLLLKPVLWVSLEHGDLLGHLLGEDEDVLQSHKQVFLAGPRLLASCHNSLNSLDTRHRSFQRAFWLGLGVSADRELWPEGISEGMFIVCVDAAEVAGQDPGLQGELQAEKFKACVQAGRWPGGESQDLSHIHQSICEHMNFPHGKQVLPLTCSSAHRRPESLAAFCSL